MLIDKQNLYKLPYSKNNNPNGWIEPTTFCQLKCPHCYRGVGKVGFQPVHRDLSAVLAEIDELIKIRNIQNLFIAGGEPLLYPNLDEMIAYAKSKQLDVTIETNGILLDKEMLIRLKQLKVTEIIIHIDKFQGREKAGTEQKVNQLREKYCNLFREVGGVALGFIMPLSAGNINDLEVLLPFYKSNADIIKLVAFTLLREPHPKYSLSQEELANPQLVWQKIRDIYGLEYCAFLGKIKSDEISWLIAHSFFKGNKFLGSADKKVVEIFQQSSLKKFGKYSFISSRNINSFNFAVSILLNKSMRQIIKKFLFTGGKPILNQQMTLIINTPQPADSGWDLCDGCPDAILYQQKLVPSCLLERVKKGEEIYI